MKHQYTVWYIANGKRDMFTTSNFEKCMRLISVIEIFYNGTITEFNSFPIDDEDDDTSVVANNGVVKDGHHRVAALRELGM